MTDRQESYALMYRGPLSSCNYACGYCPFAKRIESNERLQKDRDSLSRFVAWIAAENNTRWRVLFTPWGEALVRDWYRAAVRELSQLQNVDLVAAQTNLSFPLAWLEACDPSRVGFQAAFHPSECRLSDFARKVTEIVARGFFVSAGMVAAFEHLDLIAALRQQLPNSVPIWINPLQPRSRPYHPGEMETIAAVDPGFPASIHRRKTRGLPCFAGETSFTVDGDGNIRRCHFVDEVLGNISTSDWRQALRPRRCPRLHCDCHLGEAPFRSANAIEAIAEVRLPGFFQPLTKTAR